MSLPFLTISSVSQIHDGALLEDTAGDLLQSWGEQCLAQAKRTYFDGSPLACASTVVSAVLSLDNL